MRSFHIEGERFSEVAELPATLPPQGFLWLSCTRAELRQRLAEVQAALQRCCGGQLVDLHVSDLLNDQLPSHYDYTSWYDVMVFRRLAPSAQPAAPGPVLAAIIDTSPVGFALFDRLLFSVHPGDCAVRDWFAQRMAGLVATAPRVDAIESSERGEVLEGGEGGERVAATLAGDTRGSARLPPSAADLMLRMVNHIVDSYLDLRRQLTRQFADLQGELLAPKSRFDSWPVMLASRNALHAVEDICEDQRAAIQEWIDALEDWPLEGEPAKRRERELLRVRSRDVLEHIERVLGHVRRLEQSAETAVQMHFSALSHRTNDIMRTLTVLTAIFLPLNLITGFFGMNFDALPLIHAQRGVVAASGLMAVVAVALVLVFWRKRYLSGRTR